MQSKELIEAATKGNLAVVERLLAIEAVKKNAHARDNEALRWTADGGHLAVVEQLLAIEIVKKMCILWIIKHYKEQQEETI